MNYYSTKAIRGTVQIQQKDKSGSALQLCLQTDGFKKYIIENGSEHGNLFSLIGEEIIIYCERLNDDYHNLPYIRVKSYKHVKSI